MEKSYWACLYKDGESEAYTVVVPDLPGCITEGFSWDEAMYMARDAVQGWLETTLADGDPIPEPSSRERAMAMEAAESATAPRMELVTVELSGRPGAAAPGVIAADLAGRPAAPMAPVP